MTRTLRDHITTALVAVGLVGGLAAIITGIVLASRAGDGQQVRNWRDTCQALNAQPVETGANFYVCVTSDGRIVGPVAE